MTFNSVKIFGKRYKYQDPAIYINEPSNLTKYFLCPWESWQGPGDPT
jgi:hypothetical protein